MTLSKSDLEEIRRELEKKGLRQPKDKKARKRTPGRHKRKRPQKKKVRKERPSLRRDIKRSIFGGGRKVISKASKASEGVIFGAKGKRRIVSQSTYDKRKRSG